MQGRVIDRTDPAAHRMAELAAQYAVSFAELTYFKAQ